MLFHPVAYHLLDVAATADAILTARPLARARAARLLGLTPDEAQRLLVALIALHDIGKFTPAFQGKAPICWPSVLGPCDDPTRFVSTPHTDDGYTLWHGALAPMCGDHLWPSGKLALDDLALAVFGHHGRPIVSVTAGERSMERVFGGIGSRMAIRCADDVISLLHPAPIMRAGPRREAAQIVTWWLAGLATVADWIGSNEEKWFPYVAPDSEDGLSAYWDRARGNAARAVREAGLVTPRSAPLRSFATLTGVSSSSPAQEWASTVSLSEGSVLVILEDVTGAGKTEAAQMLVHRLMADGRAAGAYWAMPTQATANAMYGRQADALDALFGEGDDAGRPSLILAHGQASLHERFRASILGGAGEFAADGGMEPSDDGDVASGVACAAFLAHDRRTALLADIGAGTVDQALLGILPSRFNTVRLFALADKVLIVDEAHAYDAYMNTEVKDLLRFQAALGGCAIVLSATLTQRQRNNLVVAWKDGLDGGQPRGGAGWSVVTPRLVSSTSYPLGTVVAAGEPSVRETPLRAAPWSRRTVSARLVHCEADAVEHIVKMAACDAAVVWIRNTVNDCLKAATDLRQRGLAPIVFHARFAQGDRQLREQEVLASFGKGASATDRRGKVLVATQVVEQSLDLDFDAMVSDLAPIDLLIQRAGRLWRHPSRDRTRPAGVERVLVVLAPPVNAEPEDDWITALLPGTAKVYADWGILWRTARMLADVGGIETPDGIRAMVEGVYEGADTPPALERAEQLARGKANADAATAIYTTLKLAGGYHGGAQQWVDELRILTRLGDPQTVIRLARLNPDVGLEPWFQRGRHMAAWRAWALSEVRVSTRKIPAAAAAEPAYARAIATVRAAWGRYEQDIPVLPLVQQTPGDMRGRLTSPTTGRTINVRYTDADGLAYE